MCKRQHCTLHDLSRSLVDRAAGAHTEERIQAEMSFTRSDKDPPVHVLDALFMKSVAYHYDYPGQSGEARPPTQCLKS